MTPDRSDIDVDAIIDASQEWAPVNGLSRRDRAALFTRLARLGYREPEARGFVAGVNAAVASTKCSREGE